MVNNNLVIIRLDTNNNNDTTTTVVSEVRPLHNSISDSLSPPLEFCWINHVSFPVFVVDIMNTNNNKKNNLSSSKQHTEEKDYYPIVVGWNNALTTITQINATDVINQSLTSILLYYQKTTKIPTRRNNNNSHVISQSTASNNCFLNEAIRNIRYNGVSEVILRNVIFVSNNTATTVTKNDHNREGSWAASTSYRIKISSQRNPGSDKVVGLICLVEQEEDDECDATIPITTTTTTTTEQSRQFTTIASQSGSTEPVDNVKPEYEQIMNHPTTMIKNGAVQRQHQSVATLAPAEEYRLLIEKANAPIFGVDQFGIVNEWNHQMAIVTGISKGKAIGIPLLHSTLTIPIMRDAVESILQNASRGRGTSNFELEVLTHNPHLRSTSRRSSMIGPIGPNNNHLSTGECSRFLLVNVTPRRNLRQEIVGAVAIAQDVTEACNHDRAVAAMANELRQLIDTANAPIFGIDRDGCVILE